MGKHATTAIQVMAWALCISVIAVSCHWRSVEKHKAGAIEFVECVKHHEPAECDR